MISLFHQFHNDMRACIRMDDVVCLEWSNVEQGLCQERVLTPFLFNMFFTAVLNVVWFRLDSGTVEGMLKIQKHSTRAGAKECSEAWGAEDVSHEVWGILYAYGGACGGVDGVWPDRVKSKNGDNVPARKRYANGGIQCPRCRPRTVYKRERLYIFGGGITDTPSIYVEIA